MNTASNIDRTGLVGKADPYEGESLVPAFLDPCLGTGDLPSPPTTQAMNTTKLPTATGMKTGGTNFPSEDIREKQKSMETLKNSLLFYCASAIMGGMFKHKPEDPKSVPLENMEQGLHKDIANDEVTNLVLGHIDQITILSLTKTL